MQWKMIRELIKTEEMNACHSFQMVLSKHVWKPCIMFLHFIFSMRYFVLVCHINSEFALTCSPSLHLFCMFLLCLLVCPICKCLWRFCKAVGSHGSYLFSSSCTLQKILNISPISAMFKDFVSLYFYMFYKSLQRPSWTITFSSTVEIFSRLNIFPERRSSLCS